MSFIGTGANQVPLNGMLGELAYLDKPTGLKGGRFSPLSRTGSGARSFRVISGNIEVDSGGRIVVPKDGLYAISIDLTLTVFGSPNLKTGTIQVFLNNEQTLISTTASNASSVTVRSRHTGLISLKENDTIQMVVFVGGPDSIVSGIVRLEEVFMGEF